MKNTNLEKSELPFQHIIFLESIFLQFYCLLVLQLHQIHHIYPFNTIL